MQTEETRKQLTETRPWGSFTILEDLPHCKVKRLVVHSGHRLSLQYHQQREEHWTVIRGTPTITVGEKQWVAQVGEHIHIPREAHHRIANEVKEDAELIEVQLGDYFGEDDIVRLEDDYNRSSESNT